MLPCKIHLRIVFLIKFFFTLNPGSTCVLKYYFIFVRTLTVLGIELIHFLLIRFHVIARSVGELSQIRLGVKTQLPWALLVVMV